MGQITASICMSSHNRPAMLARTLTSIFDQRPSFKFEVIVVDDGSPEADTVSLCRHWPVIYKRIDREPGYRNPAKARNVAYREAMGDVVIAQSDDVIHASPDCITQLVGDLRPGRFVIATVTNVDEAGRPSSDPTGGGYGDKLAVYTSPLFRRPLFFLGSLWRRDLYAAGGCDEEFAGPGREDVWLGLCLTNGLGLEPSYSDRITGHHQRHLHTTDWAGIAASRRLFAVKQAAAAHGRIPWQASGGPWEF